MTELTEVVPGNNLAVPRNPVEKNVVFLDS